MPLLKCGWTHFYEEDAPGASVFMFRGHPGASVSRNVGVEGHPFPKNGHPFFQNASFEGHQAQPVAPFKMKKGDPAERVCFAHGAEGGSFALVRETRRSRICQDVLSRRASLLVEQASVGWGW